ncbi:MAG: peroxiredoxin [Candidatus Poseidoniia archaeon]|jgi:peroxiredoxin Q/BCP|nr:peroxiredoxin [Euryarchaeota archaeon]MDP6489840.1 peroxiredoxin [Candidatus Poseidoniia archaeon]MDP6533875.1 peroxiredoxin [Candidatus Poseidoniia archaeon]MDP6835120.1 peroxiredoxin [Candidatus Poseidoniia archaeon]HIH79327.1 peroxiredoxin [Candidatus Poseidoniia archaeon]|tara:strand:+ start:588 stop:1064 length:477 start_codon:yes stop_codon:yes gene_type:complete
MAEIPQAGDPAPPFEAVDQDGKTVALADFADRWLVLYFYPRDDTPGCTVEAQEFTALIGDFALLKCDIVGVSPDSPQKHCNFIAKYSLAVRLLTDPEHAIMEPYGAWLMKKNYGREYMGVARSTFLIAPDSTIAKVWPNVRAKGHAAKVLDALEILRE